MTIEVLIPLLRWPRLLPSAPIFWPRSVLRPVLPLPRPRGLVCDVLLWHAEHSR